MNINSTVDLINLWIKDAIKEEQKNITRLQKAHDALQKKNSSYAMGILYIIKIREIIKLLWESKPFQIKAQHNRPRGQEEIKMYNSGYNTDERLLEAIEAITGGNLDCAGECDCEGDGKHPEQCGDPAVALWRDGGREKQIRAWLDRNYTDWKNDAPLSWGAGQLSAK